MQMKSPNCIKLNDTEMTFWNIRCIKLFVTKREREACFGTSNDGIVYKTIKYTLQTG